MKKIIIILIFGLFLSVPYAESQDVATDGVFEEHETIGPNEEPTYWYPETIINNLGKSSWVTDSATSDGSGSLYIGTNTKKNKRFRGYRDQDFISLGVDVPPGSFISLSVKYRKDYGIQTPVLQTIGVTIVYSDGSVESNGWSDTTFGDNTPWLSGSKSFTLQAGKIPNYIRIWYDLQTGNNNASENWVRAWIDEVSITLTLPSGLERTFNYRELW